MSFDLPDGAQFDGRDGDDNLRFRVSMPLDDDGFLGRECKSCNRVFRVFGDEYEAMLDDAHLWCVYCGHEDEPNEFMTSQQEARLTSLMEDVGAQMMNQAAKRIFGGMSRHNNSFVRFSYTPTHVYARPLPEIDEEKLIRERTCSWCGARYVVFGDHRYCPMSGRLPARDVAIDALAAESRRLDALNELPASSKASLREAGVLDRQYVDTIENLVGVVEALANSVFEESVPNSDAVLRGKGRNVFQRLDDLADLFDAHLDVDVRTQMGDAWLGLLATWAGRHLYAHNDGIVDAKYKQAIPGSHLQIGQRLPVTEADARQAIDSVRDLIALIA